MQIGKNEVHLWLVDTNVIDRALISRYRGLMAAEEIERNRCYQSEERRNTDVVARALVRTTLSRYREVCPTEWRFSKSAHGKPEISQPVLEQPLCFNLSHTWGQVVCAVTLGCRVGVDVEWMKRNNSLLSIAAQFFSSQEVEDLLALPESVQRTTFFDYWTLKEAYIKARGEGMALGLDNFCFHLAGGERISISFTHAANECPDKWFFQLFDATPQHRLAVALCSDNLSAMTVRVFDTVPLTEHVNERLR